MGSLTKCQGHAIVCCWVAIRHTATNPVFGQPELGAMIASLKLKTNQCFSCQQVPDGPWTGLGLLRAPGRSKKI